MVCAGTPLQRKAKEKINYWCVSTLSFNTHSCLALLSHELSKAQTEAGVPVISLSLWLGVSPHLCSQSSFALQHWKEGAALVARI